MLFLLLLKLLDGLSAEQGRPIRLHLGVSLLQLSMCRHFPVQFLTSGTPLGRQCLQAAFHLRQPFLYDMSALCPFIPLADKLPDVVLQLPFFQPLFPVWQQSDL